MNIQKLAELYVILTKKGEYKLGLDLIDAIDDENIIEFARTVRALKNI